MVKRKCKKCSKIYETYPSTRKLFCSWTCFTAWTRNHGNIIGKLHMKHGMEGTPTYLTWANMIQRCMNPSNSSYKDYGKRGISIYPEWKDFSKFFADMGKRPKEKTLERVDNNKGYSKDNCKWATRIEQNNNSRHCTFITFRGKTLSISQWERYLGYAKGTIKSRLGQFRWNVEKALTQPLMRGGIPYGVCRFPNRIKRISRSPQ